jgi:hypothetical protein
MTQWASGHPDDGVLLRYLDGELRGRETRRVRAHLEACWQCRCEREALEATVGDCVEYRRKAMAAGMPEPPRPWIDIYAAMNRQDARAEKAAIAPGWRWAAAVLAAGLALALVYRQFERPPAVEAAALLNRAEAAAEARPAKPHRVRIRAGRQEFVRNSGVRPASRAAAGEAMPAGMKNLFERAHYDDADPLSARAYAEWRDGAGEKRDRVVESAGLYEIRTVVFSGELAEASLTLRAADLEPVAGRLQFRDDNSLEFTRVSEPPAPADGFAVASHEGVPVRPAVPSRPAATSPRNSASISDELEVLAALHKIGADLGDPVQVTLADGRVAVEGAGLAPDRQRQIHALLDAHPNVVVRFSEPAPSGGIPPAGGDAAPTAAPPAPRLEARLEGLAGGHAQWEDLSSRLLDANEAAMARAYALRGLAQRFPPGGTTALSAADRHTLQALAAEHVNAMAAQVEAIEGSLGPVLAGLGAPIPKSTPAHFAAWQTAGEEAFAAARRQEMLLSLLLGVAPGTQPAGLPADLARTLAEVRSDLEECLRVLEQ